MHKLRRVVDIVDIAHEMPTLTQLAIWRFIAYLCLGWNHFVSLVIFISGEPKVPGTPKTLHELFSPWYD